MAAASLAAFAVAVWAACAAVRSRRASSASASDCHQVEEDDLCPRRAHGPKEPRSTVFSLEDEAIVVPFRKHTLLPLDDCRKLHLFVAIDRTSKFAFDELHEKRREP
jgi:hypothetical protein